MYQSLDEQPTTTTVWSPQRFTLADGTKIDVLTRPTPDDDAVWILSQAPQLVYSRQNEPLFSLSLILTRPPAPTEDNVRPLIERGLLTLTVQTGVSPAVLEAISNCCIGSFERLFARKVEYVLSQMVSEEEPSRVLASVEGSGTEGRSGISVHLDRKQTLDILAALDQSPSSFKLDATVSYRSTGSPRTVHLSGSWSQIHDYLSLRENRFGRLTEAGLQNLLPILSDKGLLRISDTDGNPTKVSPEPLYRLFMRQASIILRRGNMTEDGETWYQLRSRPHDSFYLNYSETIHDANWETCELEISLEQLIGGILVGRNWDDYVHLIARQTNETATPVPRRMQAAPNRQARQSVTTGLQVAALGKQVTSLSLATSPNTLTVAPHKFNQLKRPDLAFNQAMLDDIRIELPQQDRPRSLPIIHDPKANYWRDRLSDKQLWYAPVFEIVAPSPGSDPAHSPFLFSYQRVGVTNTGQPALRGEIQLTLRSRMSDATAQALKTSQSRVLPVPFNQLAVSLLIPFVNTDDGRVKQHRFTATDVAEKGDLITAKVALLNEWVRLAYGTLAIENFQTLTVQIQVDYAFSGYIPVKEKDLELAYGGKAFHTPVVYSAVEATRLKGSTYFDAASLTYLQPQTQLRFQREDAVSARQDRRTFTATASLAQLHKPALSASVATLPTVRPELTVAPNVATLLKQVEYATRTQVRQQSQTILLPCRNFGRFYQTFDGDSTTTIGCQDALTLGQTQYRQYEEITELHTARYRVYRSLQQPGQFLLLPAQFCISRRSASEADAYRPLIFLHALLDAKDTANNRVELRATLQPDLTLFERSELLERLKGYDIQPVLEYPTDIDSEAVNFTWVIDPQIAATIEASPLDTAGPFLSTYFQMDLPSWQLMLSILNSSGLSGSISFELADGTHLSANLLLKLDHIRGPWEVGPLAVTHNQNQLSLTNKIERTVEVSDLVNSVGTAREREIPVEVAIPPGQTHTVQTNHDLQPIYSYPPSEPVEIEEIRSFVENIYSNFIFISLVNFTNHNLQRLDVEARVQGMPDRYIAQLTPGMPVADIPIVLPLTTYLEQRVLKFRVTKIFDNNRSDLTDWMQWDLEAAGPVSITSALIGL